jgi:hypothetical protein
VILISRLLNKSGENQLKFYFGGPTVIGQGGVFSNLSNALGILGPQ